LGVTQRDAGQGNELTVIGRGTTIRGEVDFDQGARILGVFEGKIRSQGEVQIGDTAECRAEIDATRIRIDGHLEGDVIARERLLLSETANMTGDIRAATLHVDEGATFVGHCRVGVDALENSGTGGTNAARTAPATSEPKATGTTRTKPLAVEVGQPPVDFKPPWREASRADAATDVERGATAETGAA
jgi:cytoskeletal protein CcmA (bactofilin family)